ncbi:GNAT family N-acetyltransferase [Fictibacillus sp. B-59209]|uniref:GNAT family N-acetyltransferase n=1 Tax=Fictibacillus sp. B-59209 TaxID=3024873 RepID=UPI002E22668D|nr:GNAT family N-acetyltransferase [Fictibacillus sp. B-59209]
MNLNKEVIVKVRTVKLEDALAVLTIQKEVVAEGEFLPTISAEFKKTDDHQREWIRLLLENERETMLVAEMNNEIVGWIVFLSQNRIRLSHVGSIGMMIKKEYRSMGIGKKLINELLNWAKKNTLIEKVGLGVLSSNQRAISLYKKMGFLEEGRKVREIKINNENYVDDILMYRFV